jgi:hypothetical protein
MNQRSLSILLAIILASPILANGEKEKKSDSQAVMDMYIEMAKPVASHDRLRAFTGTWNVASSMWMSPSEPPLRVNGTATGRMILGGRFLQLDTTLGAPYAEEMLTILGFDGRTNEYTLVGYDTLGTYYITAAGKHDAVKNAIVLDGEYAQPPSGTMQSYRFVLEQPRPAEHRMRLYFAMPDGKDMLVSEIIMTKAER